jgi:hypothetical protein
MRCLFILLLLSLFLLPVSAEDSSDYVLDELSAEEFLAALPDILANAQVLKGGGEGYSLLEMVVSEWILRYEGEAVSPETAVNAYQSMMNVGNGYWYDVPIILEVVANAFLNAKLISLNPRETSQLDYLGFHVEAIPQDFNGDHQPEWILEFSDAMDTQMSFVIEGNADSYSFVEAPLPWFACCFAYWSQLSGFMETQLFADLTGDGLPEWVLAVGGIGGGHQNHGHLIILKWHEDKLVNIATYGENGWGDDSMGYSNAAGGGSPLFPWGTRLRYEDTDSNGTTEVIIEQEFRDNWGCHPSQTRYFAYDVAQDRFQYQHDSWEYDDETCDLRFAQEAMWSGDYAAAIPLYEQSLDYYASLDADAYFPIYGIDNAVVETSYIKLRLALAYAFIGQSNETSRILNELEPIVVDNPNYYLPIPNLILAAKAAFAEHGSANDLCVVMYNSFASYFQNWDANTYWGDTWNIPSPSGAPNSAWPQPHPERAGCDAPAILENVLDNSELLLGEDPINILEAADFHVLEGYHADMNEDGILDYLLWLEMQGNPLLFSSAEQAYLISYPNILRPDAYGSFHQIVLPNGENAIAYLYANEDYPAYGGYGSADACILSNWEFIRTGPTRKIFLQLYTYEEDSLTLLQEFSLCEERDIKSLFSPDMSQISAWTGFWQNELFTYFPTVFTWNSETNQYEAPLMPSLNVVPSQESISIEPLSFSESFAIGDFEAVVTSANEQIELLLAQDELNLPYLQQAYYVQALAFEELGRDEEALATYLACYELAPDSAWGMLADLHFVNANS